MYKVNDRVEVIKLPIKCENKKKRTCQHRDICPYVGRTGRIDSVNVKPKWGKVRNELEVRCDDFDSSWCSAIQESELIPIVPQTKLEKAIQNAVLKIKENK